MKSKEAVRVLQTGEAYNKCLASTNNILAVASSDGNLRLWDVLNWEVFAAEDYVVGPIICVYKFKSQKVGFYSLNHN